MINIARQVYLYLGLAAAILSVAVYTWFGGWGGFILGAIYSVGLAIIVGAIYGLFTGVLALFDIANDVRAIRKIAETQQRESP